MYLVLTMAMEGKQAIAPTLVAQLDYGTFVGSYSSTYNISYWQKIPFAAPPVGENRFRAPQAPIPITNGTYDSTQSFELCPQRTVSGSEDCLYLGLYGRPWTEGQALGPVVVNFYGGGFIEGNAYFTIPPAGFPTLNVSSSNNFIFVYPNYHADDPRSDLNPGLLDQHAALQWVHNHISKFGGDPTNVAIWGQSAGAGSVVAQVIAQDGRTKPRLFNKAIASSPFWERTYDYDAPQVQELYDSLINMTNCAGPSSLRCLKSLDLQSLRTAALAISRSHTYNTSSYSWAPVIDGVFLTQTLTSAIANSAVNIDYGFGMYNLNDGENFIPPGLQNATDTGSPPYNSSLASFETWLRGYLPGLSEANLEYVKVLYPVQGSAEGLTSYNTTYVRAGLIYRDTTLACPALWMASAAHKESYLGIYTIPPAKHGSDTYWWNQVNSAQETDPYTYHGYTGALASFFQTGDPMRISLPMLRLLVCLNSRIAGRSL
ncbi:carboxylesterase [Delphinella strobiligena]|nr:carboxylesterase [Delphinella strobiligena]